MELMTTPWYAVVLPYVPVVLFAVWCLWAVNWRRTWPVLAAGGWVPLVLLGLMAAYVWSRVWPTRAVLFGFLGVPNLVWQLGAVALLIGVALFCGWLQGRYGWEPAEVSLEPQAHGHAHAHDHHGHDNHHAPAALSHNGHTTAH